MLMMVFLPVSINLVELYVLQLLFVQSQLLLDDLLEEFFVQRLQHLLSFHVILAPVLVDGLWMRQLLPVGVDHLHCDCLRQLIVIDLIQRTANFHLFLVELNLTRWRVVEPLLWLLFTLLIVRGS